LAVAISLVTVQAAVAQGPSPSSGADDGVALGQLYELQAAFHGAASVRDAVDGDTPDVITDRIRDMLALWATDGSLHLTVGGKNDGDYVGNGDPDDPATCPELSGEAGGPRGTLCTFFKYVAGSFQPANKLISLAPSYLTHFDVHGDTADVYFQCHYFDVSKDPWVPVSHLVFDGTASRIDGVWLFTHADAPVAPGIPVPGSDPAAMARPDIAGVVPSC
jgi:hypothetical protein